MKGEMEEEEGEVLIVEAMRLDVVVEE